MPGVLAERRCPPVRPAVASVMINPADARCALVLRHPFVSVPSRGGAATEVQRRHEGAGWPPLRLELSGQQGRVVSQGEGHVPVSSARRVAVSFPELLCDAAIGRPLTHDGEGRFPFLPSQSYISAQGLAAGPFTFRISRRCEKCDQDSGTPRREPEIQGFMFDVIGIVGRVRPD